MVPVLGIALLVATAPGTPAAAPAVKSAAPVKPAKRPDGFKVVGYFASWSGGVEHVQWNRLTHVNFAFVVPTREGGLKPVGGLTHLPALVKAGKAHKVPVSIAVGGWNDGDDSAFEHIAVRPELRAAFVRNLLDFVARHQLDGVDIDWEYPEEGASAAGFLALMKDLRAALAPQGKLLTAAVVSLGYYGAGIPDGAFALVDFLNIMAYDADDGGEKLVHHSPYDFAERSLRYWLQRGLPKEKAILGVPFYGKKPFTAYRKLVARDPEAPKKDQVGEIRYNGIATIKRKTALARAEGGGIMIWELSDDTHDGTSLLKAISEAAALPVAR
ncbi:MAG TPA: glycosyl hydrolase family 18 protein [Polyangia bacterium]